ncbi:hypothetical protein [Shewanella algae]|uniref:hypothetical protein n=1 Tax=Shewanella algae TaxID=38313 RepID=UPI00399BDA4C
MSVFAWSVPNFEGRLVPRRLNVGFFPKEVQLFLELSDDQLEQLVRESDYTYHCYTGNQTPMVTHEVFYKYAEQKYPGIKEHIEGYLNKVWEEQAARIEAEQSRRKAQRESEVV